jgi:hypothetical protein
MKWLTGFLLLMVVSSASSTEQISERLITKISVYDSYAVAALSSPGENIDGCTLESAQFVKIETTSDSGKEMYAAVLAARVSKQPVGFGVTGCSSWGTKTIPLVYRVDF